MLFSILIGATFKGKTMLSFNSRSFKTQFIAYFVTGLKTVIIGLIFWWVFFPPIAK